MLPEKQVTSINPSKRLAKLGVKQDSWLYWHITKKEGIQLTDSPIFRPCFAEHRYIETRDRCVTGGSIEIYSAFNVVELMTKLSKVEYESLGFPVLFLTYNNLIGWSCGFRNPEWENPEIKEKNIADAPAEYLIWLIENKHIKNKDSIFK